jgi:hypothetical protein
VQQPSGDPLGFPLRDPLCPRGPPLIATDGLLFLATTSEITWLALEAQEKHHRLGLANDQSRLSSRHSLQLDQLPAWMATME